MEEFPIFQAQKFQLMAHILWAQDLVIHVILGTGDMGGISIVIVYSLEYGHNLSQIVYLLMKVSKFYSYCIVQ